MTEKVNVEQKGEDSNINQDSNAQLMPLDRIETDTKALKEKEKAVDLLRMKSREAAIAMMFDLVSKAYLVMRRKKRRLGVMN